MPQAAWRSRSHLRAETSSLARLDWELRTGRYVSVTRDALLPATVSDDLWQRSGAALSTQHPGALISRRTAAVLHEFPWLPDCWPHERICVEAPPDDTTRSSREGIDRRLCFVPPVDATDLDGLRITSIARTAVDLARHEPRDLVVPILDGLLTEGRTTTPELLAVLAGMRRVRQVRVARDLVGQARAGVGSPRETHMRLRIVDAGLPEPDTNLLIQEDGITLAQGDLGYWRWLIWIEYDGREPHEELRINGADQTKDRWLRRRGWVVMRLTNRDYYRPGTFLRELQDEIRDAPMRIAALRSSRSPEVAAARLALGLT